MADITVQQLTKYYGDTLVLDAISFDIQAGEKVALLGANGAGKSTLMHILTGRLAYDSGTVAIASGKTVGIIDQMPNIRQTATVDDVLRTAFAEHHQTLIKMQTMEQQMADGITDEALFQRYDALSARLHALGGYQIEHEIDKVVNGLSIPQSQREQAFLSLSGGEQTRIHLARILLQRTDILLLDEPTNHLDMQAVQWLGEYLDSYRGTVLTVSHDRWFLDRCCTRMMEIREHKLDFYAGSYSFYAEERPRRIAQQLKQHEHEQAEYDRLAKTAQKMHAHGTEHLAKRAASIEKRMARMQVTDRPRPEKQMHLRFGDSNYDTVDVLKVKDLAKRYGGRTIFKDLSFSIRNGERVALLGENGAGKTTLLRLLTGEEPPDAGTIRRGVGLKTAYLPQHVHFANEGRNLIDTLIYDKNWSMQQARNRLGNFLFSGEEQYKLVSQLSGGEKSRLRLCQLLYDPVHLLILDEPTNHLDILSREWLESAIEGFDGTLLFVSHDRYFVERFATRVLYLKAGELIDFAGTYADFLHYMETQQAKPAEQIPSKSAKPKVQGGGRKPLQKQLATIERSITQLEDTLEHLTAQIAASATDPDALLPLLSQQEEATHQLDTLMEEWETVSMQLDAMEAEG